MSGDYYATLGVDKNASHDQIKKAYRRLALQYHPDVNSTNPQAEDRFKEITEAYGVLIDPNKRRIYDENRRFGFDRNTVFNDIFSHEEYRDVFKDLPISREWIDRLMAISRVFAYEAAGGGTPASIVRRSVGRIASQTANAAFHNVMDIHQNIHIPHELAAKGGHITIDYKPGFKNRRIKIRIPRNITEGAVLRLAGMGRKNFGSHSGDLYLHLDISSQ